MSTTLGNIVTLANDRRRDTTSNSVDMTTDGLRAINGALQIWNEQHDWEWQITKTIINYNPGVYTYPIDATLLFKSLIDVRPYRTLQDNAELYYISNNKFDSDYTHSNKFAIKMDDQKKYLRMKYMAGDQASLNQATGYNTNGTWVGLTAISNISTDLYEYYDLGVGSVKFDYSGTTGTLTCPDMTAIDVSRYAQRSAIYFNVYLQSITSFSSITVKVGSSSSNYITASLTTDYLGNTPIVGWNKFKLNWNGSTTVVGTLVTTAFNYVQFTIAYSVNPSTVGNRIENVFISENIPMTLEYYSHFMTIDISASNAKDQIFNDGSATGDFALWSGQWDFVNEAFINSVMEIITWMTGEQEDRKTSLERITALVEPIKSKIPSKRRYAEVSLVADLNNPGSGTRYNRYGYGGNRYNY